METTEVHVTAFTCTSDKQKTTTGNKKQHVTRTI